MQQGPPEPEPQTLQQRMVVPTGPPQRVQQAQAQGLADRRTRRLAHANAPRGIWARRQLQTHRPAR